MYGIILLVAVALVSLLIARIATVALTVTGMSREPARFQARSALTGVGFTTSEAESVVNHPIRRRIVMTLMLVGNVGLATAVAGLLSTFTRAEAGTGAIRAVVLVIGLGLVYAASRSAVVDRFLSRVIGRWLRRYTTLEGRDYYRLLHLAGDYAVQEFAVRPDHWLAGLALGEARLRDEGILVLGIVRSDGTFLGVPSKQTVIDPGDTEFVYGRGDSIKGLDERRDGAGARRDRARAVEEQQAVEADERAT